MANAAKVRCEKCAGLCYVEEHQPELWICHVCGFSSVRLAAGFEGLKQRGERSGPTKGWAKRLIAAIQRRKQQTDNNTQDR